MSVAKVTRGFTLCCALLSAPFLVGQDHQHSTLSKTKTYSGADRPDLISDAEAYRAVFTVAAAQPHLLDAAGLTTADQKIATRFIVSYQKEFELLLKAQNQTTNPTEFVHRLNTLLKQTQDALANRMTADGYEGLEAFVQSEKRRMTITLAASGENQ